MPPPYSQLAIPSASLKRRRAASAPCEDDAIRNSKRSRSDVDHFATKALPLPIVESQDEEEEGEFSNETKKIDKGKAKLILRPMSGSPTLPNATVLNKSAIEELALELKCGCCTELCYNPVVVNPCQHYFCGSCCVLWVRHGGTNCPACRGISTSVIPSRVVQTMIDLLLRLDPSQARTENERLQADKVYKCGTSLILPTPRPKSPEPNLEATNDNLARPCPTCLPGNPYGWQCPIPIQDPIANPDNAFDLDDGTPPGHAFCGNCDQLHNTEAPSTTKCDFCQVSFCGIEIQARCCALGLLSQQAHGMSDIPDIILNGTIYERFNENTVEVDIMLDYLRSSNISLRSVYRDIVSHIIKQPQGFSALIDSGAFDDIHNVSGGEDPDPSAPRRRICRLCAAQVLVYGLKGWWIRERKKAKTSGNFLIREDCPQGENCNRQADPSHAKEFNHIISDPYDIAAETEVGPSTDNSSAGTSRNQSHNVIVPRAVPFSILMPFPISQPGSEGVIMDRDIFPLPNENAPGPSSQGIGHVDILLPFGNPTSRDGSSVEDGEFEVNGDSSGSGIPMERTQEEVQPPTNYSEELSPNAFLGSSASPYVPPDPSVIPISGDITPLISSSSYLSPVFPTST